MIQESYCSFEVAKLLKEKGFDEPCRYFYKFDSKERYYGTELTNSLVGDKIYNTCTHQMACAWLREKYGLHIYTFYENEFHWHYVIDSLTKKWRYSVSENKSNDEAIEKALKYSLENLI